jgi:Na+-transporting NADH:ubiquinone oxidoreductase subunit A
MRFKIRKGLDLPLAGAPEPTITEAPPVGSVALLVQDHPGLRPTLSVRDGERVVLGQVLFHDRENPDVAFTSPGAGIVRIDRGTRRSLRAVIVELEGDGEVGFTAFSRRDLPTLDGTRVREILLASGLWTALRTRPYGTVARPGETPGALFVTATDTNPLAPAPHVAIDAQRESFSDGLTALARLTDAPIFLCKATGVVIPTCDSGNLTVAEFAGPHPAGLVGTHIQLLAPASARRTVWHIGYQDVIAIGKLLTTGRLSTERLIALGGPMVRRPRYLRTRPGARIDDLLRNELHEGPCRVISGSVLSGRAAAASGGFLGRYHCQVSVIPNPPTELCDEAQGYLLGRPATIDAFREFTHKDAPDAAGMATVTRLRR